MIVALCLIPCFRGIRGIGSAISSPFCWAKPIVQFIDYFRIGMCGFVVCLAFFVCLFAFVLFLGGGWRCKEIDLEGS